MTSLTFEPWLHWDNRAETPNHDRPGVYVLARFDETPCTEVDPTAAEIIYIGETCSQTLADRWYQFGRSAFQQKSGHSGGWTFAATYCDNRVMPPPAWLYVAALPVALDEPHASAFIRYAERRLIWEFVQRHGIMTPCNSK